MPLLLLLACQSQGSSQKASVNGPAAVASAQTRPSSVQLLLAGDFERVSRATTGHAELVRRGATYELVLTNVTVATDSKLRVYLVGHDRASTTFLVDATELKYDMAELEGGATRQVIELPSEPDPRLRSVVLYNPAFGINVAFAPLRAVSPTP